jgi:RHS repeat-associated protein
VALISVGLAGSLMAHICGEAQITVAVGRTAIYEIKADVQESEESAYNVLFNPDPAIADVSPPSFTSFNYGKFYIDAKSPGTNRVALEWSYAPRNAGGFCSVEIIVVDPHASLQTAANHPQSATAGDPVNVFTGELVLQEEADLDLGGPMPLYFARYYASGLSRDGLLQSGLGRNWAHNFDTHLIRSVDRVQIITFQGRRIEFVKRNDAWQRAASEATPWQLREENGQFVFGDPREQRIYRFDGEGRLVSIADGKGNRHTLTYSGQLLTEVSDGLGRVLRFRYQGFQELQEVTDGTRTVRFSGASGNLLSVTDVLGKLTRFFYDDSKAGGGLLTEKTLPLSNVPLSQTYDALGRVIRQTEMGRHSHSFFYEGNTTTVTDPLGHRRRCVHDDGGRLISVVDEAGRAIGIGYSATGQRTSITNRLGGVTRTEFHANSGRPAAVTYPDGTRTTFDYAERRVEGLSFFDLARSAYPDGSTEGLGYDAAGNLLTETNRLGHVSSHRYNGRGQRTHSTLPTGATAVYEYNEDGTIATISDYAGNVTRFTHDSLRRVIGETYADGTVRGQQLDAMNRAVRRTNEVGGVTAYVYDDNGNLALKTSSLGQQSLYTYDTADRLVGSEEPGGHTAQFQFDELGRLNAVASHGQMNRIEYDPVGRIRRMIDPLGNIWERTFDAEGILASDKNPLAETHRFGADPLGRVVEMASPLGNTRRMKRDVMGRVTEVMEPDGTATTHEFDRGGYLRRTSEAAPGLAAEYRRDALGKLSEMTDPNGAIWKRDHDAAGRVTALRDPSGNATLYEYDRRGRQSRVVFPGGLGQLDVSYDGMGSITRRRYSDGTDLQYQHDLRGQFTGGTGITLSRDEMDRIVECNGLAIAYTESGEISEVAFAPGKAVSFRYNERRELIEVRDWAGGSSTFAYDAAGRLKTFVRANGITATYTFDGESRVTRIQEGALADLTLLRDSNGRITEAQRTPGWTGPAASIVQQQQFDAASQATGFTYDALGRLLRDAKRTYAWDLASRLTSYTESGQTVSFTYDGVGQRLSRTAAGVEERYLWNYALGIPSIAMIRRGSADERYFVHTPEGVLLYSITPDGAREFYHYDETGNVRFLTDDSGRMAATYEYGPYGEWMAATGASANPFTYQGMFGVMREGSSGLYYMRARYYDSESSRFISRDPLLTTLPKAINPYQYALANPLQYQDPLGLEAVPIEGGGAPPAPSPAPSAQETDREKPDEEVAEVVTSKPGGGRRLHTGLVVLPESDFAVEVSRVKAVLRERVKKAEYGWFDPSVPANFDSAYLRRQTENFYFRGHILNGGELNYYFQGMYWREAGVSKDEMVAIIHAWKAHRYSSSPSANDLFAACEGYDDCGDFYSEFRYYSLELVDRTSVPVRRGGTFALKAYTVMKLYWPF